jgi:hypothetical protein
MTSSSTDKIRDMISLTRGLCESPGLVEYHLASRRTLQVLTQSNYIRDGIGLQGLHLWTFSSRQKFSSAVRLENRAHILIDGFQMDALFYLFQGLTMASDNGPLAVMLPAMLSEEYFNANDFGMASALMSLSVDACRQFPNALSGLDSREELRFQLEVQRGFVIGHEIGHLLLANSTPSQRAERATVMQARLDHAVRFASSKLAPSQSALPSAWMLHGSDERFREELFCDTVAVEMVEAVLAQLEERPPDCERLAFEAIYFSAFALDLLRSLKRVASVKLGSIDATVTDALLGRDYIRSVSLNLLSQSRFRVTKVVVDDLLKRIDRAQRSEYGLFHVLRIAETQRQQISSDEQLDNQMMARLPALYQWRADPKALLQDQIY